MNNRTHRRPFIVALLSVSALAACGGSGGDDAGTASTTQPPVTTDVPATDAPVTTDVPVTDAPVTTDVSATEVPTTAAPTTDAPATSQAAEVAPSSVAAGIKSVDGRWILVRRMIENRGYWTLPDDDHDVVEARFYELACNDDDCSTIALDSRYLNDPVMAGAFDVDFDGTTLVGSTTDLGPCTSTATGEFDGPNVAELATNLTLEAQAVDGTDVPILHGAFGFDETTEASEQCRAVNAGYTSEAWLFDPSTAPAIAAPAGVYAGSGESDLEERGIRSCEPTDPSPCDAVLRTGYVQPLLDGSQRDYFVDISITGTPSDGYRGSGQAVVGCTSDLDGQLVTDRGYTATQNAQVFAFDIGEPVVVVVLGVSGEPLPDLTPEQVAECAPFERQLVFVGLATDAPAQIDWTTPAQPGL